MHVYTTVYLLNSVLIHTLVSASTIVAVGGFLQLNSDETCKISPWASTHVRTVISICS